jgi:hypothetical protein
MQYPDRTLATCNMKTLAAHRKTETVETFWNILLQHMCENISIIQIKAFAT